MVEYVNQNHLLAYHYNNNETTDIANNRFTVRKRSRGGALCKGAGKSDYLRMEICFACKGLAKDCDTSYIGRYLAKAYSEGKSMV